MDTVDQATRSRIMASVPQRNTKPEMLLRRALHAMGLRYRVHVASLPGRPDIVFARRRVALFVHGCYWHGHQCRFGTLPSSRRSFWEAKFAANRARDATALVQLRDLGWRTLVVWECALRPGLSNRVQATALAVRDWLEGQTNSGELDGEGMRTIEMSLHENAESSREGPRTS
jgi:DNA mismatch endonuclease, patch repair protein